MKNEKSKTSKIKKQESEDDMPVRRRGRPAGRNRVPLSQEERRARNAQYERERRNETADAIEDLAKAVGCDNNIANVDLLATVISKLQNQNSDQSTEDLRRINENLENQIATLETRLGLNDKTFTELKSEDRNKGKTKSESSADSGVDLRSPSVSPTELNTISPFEMEVIKESDETGSGTQIQSDVQAELYHQMYNSSQLIWDGTSLKPPLENLTRFLLEIPAIKTPQEPESLEETTQSRPPTIKPTVRRVKLQSRVNFKDTNGRSVVRRDEPTFDLLTENEKKLLEEWYDDKF